VNDDDALDAAALADLETQRVDAETFAATHGATIDAIRSSYAPYGATIGLAYYGFDASGNKVPKLEITADVALWAWVAVQFFTYKPSASKRLLPLVPAVVEPLRRVAIATQAATPTVAAPGLQSAPRDSSTGRHLPLEPTGEITTQTLIGETELNAALTIGAGFANHRFTLAGLYKQSAV
jgi:hypothetical protein